MGRTTPVGMEAAGQAALFKGQFKITRNNPPFGDGAWRLYDLAVDPGETRDLALKNAALFSEMLGDYSAYSEKNGVLEMPEGYEPLLEIMNKAARKRAASSISSD